MPVAGSSTRGTGQWTEIQRMVLVNEVSFRRQLCSGAGLSGLTVSTAVHTLNLTKPKGFMPLIVGSFDRFARCGTPSRSRDVCMDLA